MEGTNKSYVSRINCWLLCCCVQVTTQHLHCRNKLAVWLLLPPSEETVVYFAELFCSYLSLVMLQNHRFGYASRPQVYALTLYYRIRLTHANVWESMGKPCSSMQFIESHTFYCKLRENPYQYYKSA